MRRRKRSRLYRDIVRQRIEYLYGLALEAVRRGDHEYAAWLGNYMKRLAMRSGVRMPRRVKRGLCRNCGLPLIPGVTSRVRLRTQGGMSYVVVTCNRCGWIHRYPYKKGARNAGGEREGEGEEGPPQRSRRDNREERRHEGGLEGDR